MWSFGFWEGIWGIWIGFCKEEVGFGKLVACGEEEQRWRGGFLRTLKG